MYDVIVIGAGHAGCEAALAAARLGRRTALFTLSADIIANMPCNPCIGGTAKGQIVAEIDALGGEMGRAADATSIMTRTLNQGKGAAVQSLRAQCDRVQYHGYMKQCVESEPNLHIKQAEVTEVLISGGRISGVKTATGVTYGAKAVIIAAGTYLRSTVHIGELNTKSAADGLKPANMLSESLSRAGVELRRLKTGTPARVHRRSIDTSVLERQSGDEPLPFSFDSDSKMFHVEHTPNASACYIAYTNERTHGIIRDNLQRSPLYAGVIRGAGPRYCPSIEDKVVRFADKERHQLFIEPMGLSTDEMYLQGMSSSLPEEVQEKFLRTIRGLENAEIIRPAYAIEYDCIDPLCLKPTLEFKNIAGLFGAGQFNGTSGYEEAAAQGLVAGVNAAAYCAGKECRSGSDPLVLSRASSYIGTLIDDLVTKGCDEPYRMMTARAEHRLTLRQDNAPIRLCEIGHDIGLLTDERYEKFLRLKNSYEDLLNLCRKTYINSADVPRGTFAELLKRPKYTFDTLAKYLPTSDLPSRRVIKMTETEIKYEGYVKMQTRAAARQTDLDKVRLADLDYASVGGLRLEAAEKLAAVQPATLGQAARISGVNPADISVLQVYLKREKGGAK